MGPAVFTEDGMTDPDNRPARWWAERPFWLVVLGLAAVLLPRLGAVPLRGEEHARAEVAAEMRHFGDWVVPRQHGEPYPTRPPLHNWLVAASEAAFGERDRWAVRLPSAVAVILTAGLLYGYARQFLGRVGATAAALAYPTFGEVLTQAQQAETEAVYVLFVGGSLLVWHWGYVREWRPAATWAAAYALAALACLCKGGLQPPVYLCGTVAVYLLLKRDVRFALSWGHLAGLAVGVGIAAAWAIPCAERVGWATTERIWMADTTGRFLGWTAGPVLRHLARFPAEAFGGLMPWGLLGLAFVLPGARRAVAEGRACVGFCGLAFGLGWLTIWIPPEGLTRYLAPLYPCLAVVLAAVVDAAATAPAVGAAWRRFLLAAAGLVATAGVGVVAVRFVLPGAGMAFPPAATAGYAAVLVGLAAVLVAARGGRTPGAVAAGVWAVAAGTAVAVVGPLTDARAARTHDVSAAVVALRDRLPAGEPAVGLGPVHAAVPFHLGRVIANRPADEVPAGAYFFADVTRGKRPELPFAWEEVGTVSVGRFRGEVPDREVLVGRRR
jgi:4-amino-4-deoxy-L-arabinose transferase-like glycosyltransferase